MKIFKPNDWVILKMFVFVCILILALFSIVLGATSEDVKLITLTPHLYIPPSIIAYYAVTVLCIISLMYMFSKIDKK